MSRALTVAALLAAPIAALAPRPAVACGAFYGDQVEVNPDQKIVVVRRGGVETYVFSPRFCGAATSFGVILPIPSTLTVNPTLANAALFDQLDRYTAPTIQKVCAPSGGAGCGAGAKSGDGASPPGFGTGVDVVDGGRVGIFDWTLVQATSVGAFTDWLTVNGFPYDPNNTDAYQQYVTDGWYFVAFKVSSSAVLTPGMRLCGDLGPIQLSFATAFPVVPARIAGVNAVSYTRPTWRIFAIAAAQHRLPATAPFQPTLYFSGALADAGLADYGEIAALSVNGDRLTAIDVQFPGSLASSDVTFEQDPSPSDFRSTLRQYVDCGGCQAGGAPAGFALAAALMILLTASRRRRAARG